VRIATKKQVTLDANIVFLEEKMHCHKWPIFLPSSTKKACFVQHIEEQHLKKSARPSAQSTQRRAVPGVLCTALIFEIMRLHNGECPVVHISPTRCILMPQAGG